MCAPSIGSFSKYSSVRGEIARRDALPTFLLDSIKGKKGKFENHSDEIGCQSIRISLFRLSLAKESLIWSEHLLRQRNRCFQLVKLVSATPKAD